MTYDKPVTLRQYDEATKVWSDVASLHASVNKTGGSEYLSSGALQSKATLTFEFRWSPPLSAVYLHTQLYRLRYNGDEYDVEDYDDYMEQHRTVRLLGVARGV